MIRRVVNGADLVEECVQVTLCGNGRIEVPQCAGCGVPRVLQAVIRVCGVVFFQRAQPHNALPLDFQESRVRNRFGQAVNGAGLRKDRFPDGSVSARRGLDQLSAFIGQVDGQTVKFVFHIILEVGFPGQFLRPEDPCVEVFDALHLVQ